MIIEEINPFKRVLMQKLSLLLIVNSNNIFLYKKDLEGIKKIISDCENYTKEKIIELIQIQEKLNK
jgi:hypothetical protein|tara:strand:+ start:46 stop:243 length:198 start_codon:yes stop_codon:yes gene_type:complete